MIIGYLRKNWKGIIELIFSLVIAAINFNLLLKPINIVAGGASGLALALSNIVNISISNMVTIIYIITFILSLLFLDKKTVRSIIFATITYPILIILTENIANIIVLDYFDLLLISIISGLISGISNGISYRNNYASGGISVIPLIINKYFKVSISTVSFIANAVVVLLGGYFYGINMVLYAIILLYVSSFVSNVIILGVSRNRLLFIKSNQSDKLIKYLLDNYQTSVTILENENNDNSTFFVVVDKKYYVNIRNKLRELDNNLFFIAHNCYEVEK